MAFHPRFFLFGDSREFCTSIGEHSNTHLHRRDGDRGLEGPCEVGSGATAVKKHEWHFQLSRQVESILELISHYECAEQACKRVKPTNSLMWW